MKDTFCIGHPARLVEQPVVLHTSQFNSNSSERSSGEQRILYRTKKHILPDFREEPNRIRKWTSILETS